MEALLDSRNRQLWDQLNAKYNIEVLPADNNEYSVFSKENDITFRYVPTNLCTASFTHEMLHVYLRLQGCFVGAGLKNTIQSSRILSRIMSFELLEHIGNSLDHLKMLPMYLEMGYEREKFIMDYHVHKGSPESIKNIERYYRVGKKLEPTAVDSFIGKIFSILADPNDSFNYSKELERLKKIDPLLFQINVKMLNHWSRIPFENAPLHDNYHSMLFQYYDDLKVWLSKNQFAV